MDLAKHSPQIKLPHLANLFPFFPFPFNYFDIITKKTLQLHAHESNQQKHISYLKGVESLNNYVYVTKEKHKFLLYIY